MSSSCDYESPEMAVRRVGGWCDMAASLGISWSNELVVRQSPASKDVNMEAEEATVLEAITRGHQTYVHAAVIYSMCELALAL
jgi:aminoglycoside phosphotransferase (APT) family kinase protein